LPGGAADRARSPAALNSHANPDGDGVLGPAADARLDLPRLKTEPRCLGAGFRPRFVLKRGDRLLAPASPPDLARRSQLIGTDGPRLETAKIFVQVIEQHLRACQRSCACTRKRRPPEFIWKSEGPMRWIYDTFGASTPAIS